MLAHTFGIAGYCPRWSTLIFLHTSLNVGSGQASTVHPQKYQKFPELQNYLNIKQPQKYPHSVP